MGVLGVKQHEAVILALKQYGGYATLGQLYQTAPKIPGSQWGTKTPFASIRRIVQTHKEFFRIRTGLWALTSEKTRVLRLFAREKTVSKQKDYSHYFFQGLLAEIGNMRGHATHVPAQDKNKPFGEKKLGEVATIPRLYAFTYPEIMRRALTIDVAWMNTRKFPDSFFEVEHSTEIHKSLLKFIEFQDFRVNFYIIADNHRKAEFEDKIAYSAFTAIRPNVKFRSYDEISSFHAKTSEHFLSEQKIL